MIRLNTNVYERDTDAVLEKFHNSTSLLFSTCLISTGFCTSCTYFINTCNLLPLLTNQGPFFVSLFLNICMQKLIVFLLLAGIIAIVPSCKKNNNGTADQPKPAGINFSTTRQRTVTDLTLYKYEGQRIVDSAVIAADANKIFFIDHKWLNKNKLRIVNTGVPIDEEIIVTSYNYVLQQINNNITETLLVNFTFLGKSYTINETKRIAELVLP
jgi:hypothetical protein